MCHNAVRRNGNALLDVVISLVVLGLSGVALITLLGQTAHSVRDVRNTERLIREASDELERFVAYDRSQLIPLKGRSSVRGWRLEIAQASPSLFDVSIATSDGTTWMLRTTLYRPSSRSDSANAIAP